jgi:Fes/CIP4, and EFC/F-BAR homology domain
LLRSIQASPVAAPMSDGQNYIDPSPLPSLGLTKTEYAEALLPLAPLHVVDVLRSRMKLARAVNDEIGEFFRERILVEEAYVKGLQRLSRRPPIAGITSLQYVSCGNIFY